MFQAVAKGCAARTFVQSRAKAAWAMLASVLAFCMAVACAGCGADAGNLEGGGVNSGAGAASEELDSGSSKEGGEAGDDDADSAEDDDEGDSAEAGVELSSPSEDYGVSYSIPSGWVARDVDDGVAWGPEGDADAEIRVTCEPMVGKAEDFVMQDIGFTMKRRGAGAKTVDYLEEEEGHTNGVRSLRVVTDESDRDGNHERCAGVGLALPDRAVYVWCTCKADDADDYMPAFESVLVTPKEADSEAWGMRVRIESDSDAHIEASKFAFDLPDYWVGKVDAVYTKLYGEERVLVYAQGEYEAPILDAVVLENRFVTGGDPGSGPVIRRPLEGEGKTVILRTQRFPVFVKAAGDQSRFVGYDRAVVEKNIDLQTGGSRTFQECLSGDFDEVALASFVNDYYNETIEPTVAAGTADRERVLSERASDFVRTVFTNYEAVDGEMKPVEGRLKRKERYVNPASDLANANFVNQTDDTGVLMQGNPVFATSVDVVGVDGDAVYVDVEHVVPVVDDLTPRDAVTSRVVVLFGPGNLIEHAYYVDTEFAEADLAAYRAFYDKTCEIRSEFGDPGTASPPDMEAEYLTGLAFAKLADFGDGSSRLVVGYYDPSRDDDAEKPGARQECYRVEVWEYDAAGGGLQRVHEGRGLLDGQNDYCTCLSLVEKDGATYLHEWSGNYGGPTGNVVHTYYGAGDDGAFGVANELEFKFDYQADASRSTEEYVLNGKPVSEAEAKENADAWGEHETKLRLNMLTSGDESLQPTIAQTAKTLGALWSAAR